MIENSLEEERKNFEVIQCSDGIDLIKLVVEDQNHGNLIKCVFTDENMEYINGSEAIKILRILEKKNKIKTLKIFSITCHEDVDSVKMITESGADLVLSKPISKTILINWRV